MNVTVFWDVTPCSLVDKYQRFGRNVGTYIARYKMAGNTFLLSIYRNICHILDGVNFISDGTY